MNKQKAYKIVFEDIINSGCDLMVGKYDAKNGNKEFMSGVLTVMEWIAYRVDEKVGEQFSDHFVRNIIDSNLKISSGKE